MGVQAFRETEMTKAEKQEMERLQADLRLAKALRWTEPVEPDVLKPLAGTSDTTRGYSYNTHCVRIDGIISKSHSHYRNQGGEPKVDFTGTQGGVDCYSTKALALKALRHELERKFASELARIDERIEKEATND